MGWLFHILNGLLVFSVGLLIFWEYRLKYHFDDGRTNDHKKWRKRVLWITVGIFVANQINGYHKDYQSKKERKKLTGQINTLNTNQTNLIQTFEKEKHDLSAQINLLSNQLVTINSSVKPEPHGVLTPGNDPDPSSMNVPPNAVKFFLGSVRSYSTKMDADHFIIVVRTNALVWSRRTREGFYFSADVFRGDGRTVAKIRDNRWDVNPNNYFDLTNTRHEIIVTDKDGLALRCRYLNESAVQIEGRFQLPNYPLIVITTNQVLIDGRVRIPPMITGDNYIDLYLD